FVLPDDARLACLFLVPPPELLPDSSLARMCTWVGEAFGHGVEWFVGAGGLDLERLLDRLAGAERRGDAVLVGGVTSAFIQLFDICASRRHVFRLGPGSRVMDTGGAKGLLRPLSRAGFLRACWTTLGVAGYACVNEYGRGPGCATPDRLATLVDAAIEARAGLRGRALGDTAASLCEAAARWAADARLREELPAAARLSAPVVAEAIRLSAAAVD